MSRPVTSVTLATLVGLAAALPMDRAFAQKGAHRDEEKVIEIVVRYRDDALPANKHRLPDWALAEIATALRRSVEPHGKTSDGAFRLKVAPMSFKSAREAVNRVRMLRPVLYAQAVSDQRARSKESSAAVAFANPPLPTHRLIVKYRDPAITSASRAGVALASPMLDRIEVATGLRFQMLRPGPQGSYVLQLFKRVPHSTMEAIAAQIALDPDVEYAVPDGRRQHALVPTDGGYGAQWHYFEAIGGINLPNAWNLTTGAPGIVVAVLDSGYTPHPDLVGHFVSNGYDFISDCAVANDAAPGPCTFPGGVPDFVSRDANAFDPGDWVTAAEADGNPANDPYFGWFVGCPVGNSEWHGTHVAGTIAAQTNNAYGVAGVTWKSRLLPVRGLGKCGGYDADLIDGVLWASGLPVSGVPINPFPARVINMSFGGNSACSIAWQNAINAALATGTALAVAAGNSSVNASGFSPANCNGLITVAATGRLGQRAYYSNFGAIVEIAAPGGSSDTGFIDQVWSTLNTGTTSPDLTPANLEFAYAYYQGTSMATPHVAGTAALMLARNPSLTPAQVTSIMQTSARVFPTGTGRDCTQALCGTGILDAFAALSATALPKRRDRVFDANGNADLLWTSAAAGNEVWLMAGVTPETMGALRAFPWIVAATGDFDNDGRTDIAWYNPSTGDAEATLMNGVTPGAAGTLFKSQVTQVLFTGDFDGDRKRDLLVRNSGTGALQALLMSGNTPGNAPTILTDANRVPSGVGDFNGDGKSDVVLRFNTTGATEIYLLNGGTILSNSSIRADPTWIVHKVGDFNGDGHSDILWSNSVTGATEIWLMNGALTDATLPLLDGGFWQVLLVDDFDGDGRTDILWRHQVTGALAVWLMNDFTPTKGAAFPIDPGWNVILTGDYNGDGKADLVIRNAVNGQTSIWLMDGTAPTSSGVVRTSTTFAPVP